MMDATHQILRKLPVMMDVLQQIYTECLLGADAILDVEDALGNKQTKIPVFVVLVFECLLYTGDTAGTREPKCSFLWNSRF